MSEVNAERKKTTELESSKKTKTIHVISGTHWDREWRYTAEQSLLRLAEVIDDLLDILESNPDYKCFHLDGGTVVLEDYLAIKPENADRIKRLIEQGRIKTVMWYSLAEMSSVSSEALIRNLLIGKRIADKFGGPMKTGYTATSYGQISQLPQIYSSFGMEVALTYRGTNKHQVPPICRWKSPDGSEIYNIRGFDEATRTNWFFFIHYELVLGKLPRDLRTEWDPGDWPVHMADMQTYQTAFQFCNEKFDFNTDPEKVSDALRHFVKQATPQAIGDHLLALDMEDNASPYSNLTGLIETIDKSQSSYLVKQSTLDEYAECIKQAVEHNDLPILNGEIRRTGIEIGFNGLLGMSHSSRVLLKLMNDEAECELINVAEPLSSLNAMLKGRYQHSLLNRAWLDLLKNHAHDSICGAAINEALKDNPTRYRTVTAISRECSRKSAEQIWSGIDTQVNFNEGDLTITFFNTLIAPRKGVYPIIIDAPNVVVGDNLIEPCSGAGAIVEDFDPDILVSYEQYDIVDEDGNDVPYTLLEKEKIDMEIERKLDSNAAAYKIVRNRLLMDVDIPAMGWKTYALRPRARKYVIDPQPNGDRALLAQPDGVLENEYIRININSNGTFDYTDKKNDRTVEGIHYFHDDGSTGNAHLRQQPLRNCTVTSLGSQAAISLMENNTLRATWRIDQELMIPADVDVQNRNRSQNLIALLITSWVTLRKGGKYVEIKTRVENNSRDHRLRVMIPTDIKTDTVDVDSAFDVVKRNVQWNITGDNMESHYECQPMRDFVSLTDGQNAVSFFSKGLNEYEVMDDPRRTLAITLLRCHRAYMLAARGPMTPEEYAAQDGQHNPGVTEYEYAIYLHDGNWNEAGVPALSREYKTPQRIIQGVPKEGILPSTFNMFTVTPCNLVRLSAFYKQADDGYILRLWNNGHDAAEAKLKWKIPVKSITKITMDEETVVEELDKQGDDWLLPLRKAEICTLRIKLKN